MIAKHARKEICNIELSSVAPTRTMPNMSSEIFAKNSATNSRCVTPEIEEILLKESRILASKLPGKISLNFISRAVTKDLPISIEPRVRSASGIAI
jgi:hypothetical protein